MTALFSKSPENPPGLGGTRRPARRAVPSGRRAAGRLTVPPSKSLTNRYFNLALLARRPLFVERPLWSADTRLFAAAMAAAGFAVEERGDGVELRPGFTPSEPVEIFCGNAGTMFRFLTATLTAVPGQWRLDGVPRLRERPVGPLVDALRELGAHIECLGREGFAPLAIEGGTLRAGHTWLDARSSSQFLSALLMAGLAAPGPVTIDVPSLISRPYVGVTLAAVEAMGGRVERIGERAWRVQPARLDAERVWVEGDFSAACYPAAAAALTGGDVILDGLVESSRQGDRRFLDLLERMGARVEWTGGGALRVRGGEELVAVEEDLSEMPDQVPTLAALAPFARGVTRITNVPHLRIKESDRLQAMAEELERIGVPVEEGHDGLTIPGLWAADGDRPPDNWVVVEPHDDHRIAMSMALAGLRRPGLAVADPVVVGKSYPRFWEDLDRLLG